jgi:F0F1-type ATP synthase membrane subunit c/vacuolar-type H+-ATPase subunit K
MKGPCARVNAGADAPGGAARQPAHRGPALTGVNDGRCGRLASLRPSRYQPVHRRSWLDLGSGFAEGLGGLGEGVGEGLVPLHVRAAGAEFPGPLLA